MQTAVFVIVAVSLVAAGQPGDIRAWIDTHSQRFSGTVLVGRGDSVEALTAFGTSAAGAPTPNLPTTRFNVGSISKTLTAIAIAQLIQQGRVSLDDRLIQHLPAYPNRDAATKITIRDLVSHRSGVAQFMGAEFGDVSVADMLRMVAAEPQAFEPGARQEYSNGGYIVLGRVIEVVSGVPYATYMSEHVYAPAGMTTGGPPGNPAGGGYFTATDLFRFARALKTGKLLNPRMTDYVLNGTFAGDATAKFGFALREQIVGGRRFVGNGGGAPGINAEFRFEPAGEYTVVVLANLSPPAATQLLADILSHLTAPVVPQQSAFAGPAAWPAAPRTPLRMAKPKDARTVTPAAIVVE